MGRSIFSDAVADKEFIGGVEPRAVDAQDAAFFARAVEVSVDHILWPNMSHARLHGNAVEF
jgi:hypothetical protein